MGCQGRSVQGQEGEDRRGFDEGHLDQEQVGQDREQGCVSTSEEEVRAERLEEVGWCGEGGTEAARNQWLLCGSRKDSAREGPLRQGQVHRWQVRCEGTGPFAFSRSR